MPSDLNALDVVRLDDNAESTERSLKLAEEEMESYARASDEDTIFEKKLRLGHHRRELKQIDEMLSARGNYAGRIFGLVCWWLAGLGLLILLTGFGEVVHFKLSDKVMMALIGGTTLNVLGIFTIVANFLFPKKAQDLPRWKAPKIGKSGKTKTLGESGPELVPPPPPKRRSRKAPAPSDADPV